MTKIEFLITTENPETLAKQYYANLAVNFNGWLMENLDTNYVSYLHSLQENPYSQSVRKVDDKYIWEVNILDEEQGKPILDLLFDSELDRIELKALDEAIELKKKVISQASMKYLSDVFYRQENSAYITLTFLTPTAFKSNGEYVIYPDARLIVQSLIRKFQASFNEDEEIDQEFLAELANALKINRYNLRTKYIKLHKNKIHGFTGTITYRINANASIVNYLNMLMVFAEYSGIGIKTSLGMGKVIFRNKERRE